LAKPSWLRVNTATTISGKTFGENKPTKGNGAKIRIAFAEDGGE